MAEKWEKWPKNASKMANSPFSAIFPPFSERGQMRFSAMFCPFRAGGPKWGQNRAIDSGMGRFQRFWFPVPTVSLRKDFLWQTVCLYSFKRKRGSDGTICQRRAALVLADLKKAVVAMVFLYFPGLGYLLASLNQQYVVNVLELSPVTDTETATDLNNFALDSSTTKLRIWTLRIWGFRGPGFRSTRQVLCGDASCPFLDHFSQQAVSQSGQSSVTRSGSRAPKAPNHLQR